MHILSGFHYTVKTGDFTYACDSLMHLDLSNNRVKTLAKLFCSSFQACFVHWILAPWWQQAK